MNNRFFFDIRSLAHNGKITYLMYLKFILREGLFLDKL